MLCHVELTPVASSFLNQLKILAFNGDSTSSVSDYCLSKYEGSSLRIGQEI